MARHVGHGDASVLADLVDELNGRLGCGWGAGGVAGGTGNDAFFGVAGKVWAG